MFELEISASSRVGCIRSNNEDMLLVGNTFVRDAALNARVALSECDRYLLALADGMGGHNCGEVASSDVLHNLQFFYNDLPTGLKTVDFNEMVFEWLENMKMIIDAKGRSASRFDNMGTTLVAFAYFNKEFYWMNCGDSRFYHMQKGMLRQLSTDHSLNTLLGSSEHSNVLTNCIGAGCTDCYLDLVSFTDELQAGDVLLLCSDGLTDMLSDEQLQNLLNDGADANTLCLAAEDAGGFDNVSAIVVSVV